MDPILLLSVAAAGIVTPRILRRVKRRKQRFYPMTDRDVVEQLREIGSNMDVAHLVEFFFYFPEEAGLERAAAALVAQGFTRQSSRQMEQGQWSLVVNKRMLPDAETLEDLRAPLEALAKSEKGEYDGFGAGLET